LGGGFDFGSHEDTKARRMKKLVGIAALLLLAGCGGESGQDVEFVEMPGVNQFGMIIPSHFGKDDMVAAAEAKCANAVNCSVYGWQSKVDMARDTPLKGRQAESLAFKYRVEPPHGFGSAQWNCEMYSTKMSEQCL
jgi:hypothetical protein